MVKEEIIQNISRSDFFQDAVAHFWMTRDTQTSQQQERGVTDQGSRSAVTGGKQMDGFISTISDLLIESGVPDRHIFTNKKVEIPGYFRPEKKWDLLVVQPTSDGKKELIAVMELKSQVGPSFGNNLNNRTEEAMGSALDIWTAYREGAFLISPSPWLGYLFLLEDCSDSNIPVRVKEPHFKVFPEFKGASYSERYRQFCLRLIRERIYNSTCFLTAKKENKDNRPNYHESDELSVYRFLMSLLGKIGEHYP